MTHNPNQSPASTEYVEPFDYSQVHFDPLATQAVRKAIRRMDNPRPMPEVTAPTIIACDAASGQRIPGLLGGLTGEQVTAMIIDMHTSTGNPTA